VKELLSNDEIESLMESVNLDEDFAHPSTMQGIAAHPTAARPGAVSPIDLLKPNRFSSDQMQHLERMFLRSATSIGATMSDQLRYAMHCDCVAVEQMRFSSWLPLLGDNTAVYILNAPPLEIPMFFSVTTNLLYGWVDRVLGGHGQVSDVPAEFSEAEFAVADGFLQSIFGRLVASMEELTKMSIEIEDRFTNPARARVLPAQDVILSVHFQAGSDLLLGDLRLAIDYTAIEPFLGSLGAGPDRFTATPGAMRRVLVETVQPVDLNVSINLGEAEMSVREIMSLQVGDVIALDHRTGDPMIAPVEGVPKFAGAVGTIGSRLGFRIASVLE
jgi:flagellar motor switch protein FliM